MFDSPESRFNGNVWVMNMRARFKEWRDALGTNKVEVSGSEGGPIQLESVVLAMAQASARKLNQGDTAIPVESEKLS
jgi:hypothetical protein